MPLYHWIFRLITWVFLDAFAHCPCVSVSSSSSIAETISAQHSPELTDPHHCGVLSTSVQYSETLQHGKFLPFLLTSPTCLLFLDSLGSFLLYHSLHSFYSFPLLLFSSFYFSVNTFVKCLSYSILPLRTLNVPSSLSYQFLSFCFGNFQSNLFVFVCCVFSQLLSNN